MNDMTAIAQITQKVAQKFGVEKQAIDKGQFTEERYVAIYIAKASGFTAASICRYFDVSDATVYNGIKAIKERMADDIDLRLKVKSLLPKPQVVRVEARQTESETISPQSETMPPDSETIEAESGTIEPIRETHTNGQAKPVSRVDEAVDEEMQSLADALDEDMNKAAEARTATTSRAPRPEDVGTISEPPSDPVEDAMEEQVPTIDRQETATGTDIDWDDLEWDEGLTEEDKYYSSDRALNPDGTIRPTFGDRLRNAWRALLGKPDPTLSAAWLIGKMDKPLVKLKPLEQIEIYVKGAGTLVLHGSYDLSLLDDQVAKRCGRIIQAMAEKKYLVVVE